MVGERRGEVFSVPALDCFQSYNELSELLLSRFECNFCFSSDLDVFILLFSSPSLALRLGRLLEDGVLEVYPIEVVCCCDGDDSLVGEFGEVGRLPKVRASTRKKATI